MSLTFFVNFNFRESFDKQTDFGHDEANTDIISGDTNPGDNEEAMDEVMEDTIEETLEENDDEAMDEEVMEDTIEKNDVVLDGINNDSNEEILEENNVHSDSIVMDECRYCEDAVPNKSFKAHTSNCIFLFERFISLFSH